jgi:hypothetical protein
MIKASIQLNKYATSENTIESFVSFRKFIDYLEKKAIENNGSQKHFYKFVLDKMKLIPALMDDFPINELKKYYKILDLVAAIIFPLDDDEAMVGLTSATSPEVFYGTSAFYKLFQPIHGKHSPQSWIDETSLKEVHQQFQYNLALQKIYGFVLPERNEMIHSILNQETGLYQFFRVNIDHRFTDVKVKSGMEDFCNNIINNCIAGRNRLSQIEQLISLDHFTATGFSIITLTDVTEQQAVDQIGKELMNVDQCNTEVFFSNIARLMQTILGSSNYHFGMIPFYTVNKRAALPYNNLLSSILVETSVKAGISMTVFTRYMNHYIKNPGLFYYHSSELKNMLPVPLQKALKNAGIHNYALYPLYFNNSIVGILEIEAAEDVAPLNDIMVKKIKQAIPNLSQLLMILIDKFNSTIENIIRDKFTNIQPSVQWKFNEVAWHYFRSNGIEHRAIELEKVYFREVYPLYGAIDIRNSTVKRNTVLREDLEFQLELLVSLLIRLYENGFGNKYEVLTDSCKLWISKIEKYVSIEQEVELNNFLYSQVHPLLAALDNLSGSLALDVKVYFKSIDEETGQAFAKRRQLEKSMQMLNEVIGKYFDLFNDEIQKNYPCYFDKFRTDGIEYDIYIGQSISPALPFSPEHLKRLRLLQMQSMSAITKLTHHIQPQLQYPLQTTQLIFINGHTIDISFRNDERRFDVEGAYNIRYQVIKKRIDKVHIRNTDERLTQPGKIAIVYFNESDLVPYIDNIYQLQMEKILSNDLEYLDLEELQGVAGLKAVRVGVRINI